MPEKISFKELTGTDGTDCYKSTGEPKGIIRTMGFIQSPLQEGVILHIPEETHLGQIGKEVLRSILSDRTLLTSSSHSERNVWRYVRDRSLTHIRKRSHLITSRPHLSSENLSPTRTFKDQSDPFPTQLASTRFPHLLDMSLRRSQRIHNKQVATRSRTPGPDHQL